MRRAEPDGGTSEERAILVFQVAGRHFGVELARVEQILSAQPITPTPRRLPFVEGILEHRGRYLAVASLRRRLGVSGPQPEHPAILILGGIEPDQALGVVVDQVHQVIRFPADGILAPPPRVFGVRAEYIRGIANAAGHPLVWLDLGKLLLSEEAVTLVT
jgi:purine-binding chemotaxis protein CheW